MNHEFYDGAEDLIDFYKVLGVSRNPSEDEIKIAYRRLTQEYHPDKVRHLGLKLQQEAEKIFKLVNRAYAVLGEAQKRLLYERERMDYIASSAKASGAEHFRPSKEKRDESSKAEPRKKQPEEPPRRESNKGKNIIINPKDCSELILIPAHEFLMGSPIGEGSGDEHPQHRVSLDAYYIGKYEVTNEQFAKFVQETGYKAQGS